MRTLKTFFILGLAVLLLGFMVSCKEDKNPYSNPIREIIDNPDNNEDDFPKEIVGKYYYGTELTLTGKRFEVTLKSVEFKKTVQGIISGFTWYSSDYGFIIYRYKVKNLLENPFHSGEGYPSIIPFAGVWATSGNPKEFTLENGNAFMDDCFPGETWCDYYGTLHPQEEGDFIDVVTMPKWALTSYLTIIFHDHDLGCLDEEEQQFFKFKLQFTMASLE